MQELTDRIECSYKVMTDVMTIQVRIACYVNEGEHAEFRLQRDVAILRWNIRLRPGPCFI